MRVAGGDVGLGWLLSFMGGRVSLLRIIGFGFVFSFFIEFALPVAAQTVLVPEQLPGDTRGAPELVVCSQNLHMFGAKEELSQRGVSGSSDVTSRAGLIVQRFIKAGCDVVAVQELIGRTPEALGNALQILVTELKRTTGRQFDAKNGPPGEGGMALGFLVAKDRGEILNVVSYEKVELPKLSEKQRPRLFSRGPLEIQLLVKGKSDKISKNVSIINLHLKSKRGGADDPAALEWETFRMEMAEGLRRIVERRHAQSFASGENLLLLLGDRNSDFDSASAKIIEGIVILDSFKREAGCRLSKNGSPLCRAESQLPQRLFSVLTSNPHTRGLLGTFRYKKETNWLDDIILPAESLPFAWLTPTSEGEYDSGVVSEPEDASDHSMVFVKLNW